MYIRWSGINIHNSLYMEAKRFCCTCLGGTTEVDFVMIGLRNYSQNFRYKSPVALTNALNK